MKISWIKYEKDNKNFLIPEKLGLDVYKINDLEQVDKEIEELVDKKYNTIILSNEVAGFSSDIIKKYNDNSPINIIITPRK